MGGIFWGCPDSCFLPRCEQVTLDAWHVLGRSVINEGYLKSRSFWDIFFKIETSSSMGFNFSMVLFL